MHQSSLRGLLAVAFASVVASRVAHAQTTPSALDQPSRPAAAASAANPSGVPAPANVSTLAPVIITGNPLGSREIAAPVTVLSGDELVLRRGSTLGETLNGQPGVSSTYFGPNANRPIIRGLDGDRIRILNNSGASLDASSLSFDHAVPIDPLFVERIEVLRGPSALLYGGNAIGGVVNAIDNRIPKYSLSGVSGAAEVRLGGAERERGGGALVEVGNGSFALHADAFGRKTSDLRVPDYTPVDAEGNVLARTGRIRNSAAETDGGSIGGSYTFKSGYLGLSADTYDNKYGIVAEEDVIIRMKRNHTALAGEVRDLAGPIRVVRGRIDDTRYHHEEVEGNGDIGTTFKTSGTEVRLEAEHAPLGALKGVIGGQFENFDFSALGEEAFVPTTQTRRGALFVVEELATAFGTLSGGLRVERASISSDGDADPAAMQFGPPVRRRFTLTSGSLGNVVQIDPSWSLAATLSTTARAPTTFELFANGVHAATGSFERGDTTLGKERGNNIDLALQWKQGPDHARLGVFATRFSRFISLEATGNDVDDGAGGLIPEYEFRAVKAQFHGVELEAGKRLLQRAWTLDLRGKLDYTRATNRSTGEPLPRVAPLRAGLGLDAGYDRWLGRVEVEYTSRQDRVPSYDTETAGYTLFNVALSRRFNLFGSDAFVFVKAVNLGDKLAYSASTVETIRGLSPLPGRGVKAGMRVTF